jgi:hypothetical protein
MFSPGTVSWDVESVEDLLAEVSTAYSDLTGYWRPGVVATLEPSVSIIDSTSGGLVDIITAATVPAPIESDGVGGTTSFASMITVALITSGIRNNRLVQGRHFFGPIATNTLTSGGVINSAVAAQFPTSYSGMISGIGPRLAVWSRPSSLTANDGSYEDVTTVVARTSVGVLRSRRD